MPGAYVWKGRAVSEDEFNRLNAERLQLAKTAGVQSVAQKSAERDRLRQVQQQVQLASSVLNSRPKTYLEMVNNTLAAQRKPSSVATPQQDQPQMALLQQGRMNRSIATKRQTPALNTPITPKDPTSLLLAGNIQDKPLSMKLQDDRQVFSERESQLGREHQRSMQQERSTIENQRYSYQLTAQQRADQEKYRNALYELDVSDDFTPDEKKEARRRIQAKLMGIQPIPVTKEPPKYPEGRDVGQVWKDGGYIHTRDVDGNIRKLGDDPEIMTHRDYMEYYKNAHQMLTTANADGKAITPTPDAVNALVQQMVRGRSAYMNPGQAQQPAQEMVAANAPARNEDFGSVWPASVGASSPVPTEAEDRAYLASQGKNLSESQNIAGMNDGQPMQSQAQITAARQNGVGATGDAGGVQPAKTPSPASSIQTSNLSFMVNDAVKAKNKAALMTIIPELRARAMQGDNHAAEIFFSLGGRL